MWIFINVSPTETFMVEFRGNEKPSEIRTILEKSFNIKIPADAVLPDLALWPRDGQIDLTTGSRPVAAGVSAAPARQASKANISAIAKLGFDAKTAEAALMDAQDDVKAAIKALMVQTKPVASLPQDRKAIRDLRQKFPKIPVQVIQETYDACRKDITQAEVVLQTRDKR
jgi:uncharacterized protein (DUF58 family)